MARQRRHAQSIDGQVGEPVSGAGTSGSGEHQNPGPKPSVINLMATGELSAVAAALERIESLAVEAVTNYTAYFPKILKELDHLKNGLGQVSHQLAEFATGAVKDYDEGPTHYTPALFARQAEKDELRVHLSVRTVQKWLRDKQLLGEKADPMDEQSKWSILAEEYVAFKRRGGRPRAKNKG